jgi:hypothetical protein
VAKSQIVQSSAVILSPEQLQLYGDVHPDLPLQVVISLRESRREEFLYAMRSLTFGIGGFVLVVLSFVFLVEQAHETPAYSLLGGGVISVILGFIRARLRQKELKEMFQRGTKPKLPETE